MADDASQQQPTIWKTYVRNLWWWVNPALLKAEASKVVDSRGLLNVKIHRVGRMDRPDKMCSAFVTVRDQQVATELAIGWNGASIPSMSKFQLESSAVGELVPRPRPSTKPGPVQQLWEQNQQQPPTAQKKTPVVVPPRFPRRRSTVVDAAGSSTPSRVESPSNKKDVAEGEQAKEEKPEAEQHEDAELESGEKQEQAKEQDTQEEAKEEKPEPEEAQEEKKEVLEEETKEEIPAPIHPAHGGDDPPLPKSPAANTVSAPNAAEKTAEAPGEEEEDTKTQFSHSITEDEEDTASSVPTLLRTPEKNDEEKNDEEDERNKKSSPVPASPPLTLTQCKQESDQESSLEPVAEVREEKEIRRAEKKSHKKERTYPTTPEKKRKKKKDKEKKIDKRSRQDDGVSSETSLHHQHYYMKERQQPWDRREALRRERRSYDETVKKKARWIHVCWSPKKTYTFQRINL